MKKIFKNNLGFTIVELLVSVAILGIFISLVFGTIFYVNKSGENIKASSDVQNDVKPILDSMISNIDNFGINYNYYKANGNHYNITPPMNSIVLNNNTIYRKTNNCYLNFSCAEVSFDNGLSYQKLTFNNTNVLNLDFYFIGPNPSNVMPIVTVVFSGYVQDPHKNNHNFSYQSTVEIKNYIK